MTRVRSSAPGIAAKLARPGPVRADVTPYVDLPGVASCMIESDTVVCQGNWVQAPVTPCPQCPEPMHMDQVVVDARGNLSWRDANIGQPDGPGGPGWFTLTTDQPYHGQGWTARVDETGHTVFTNDATGHGLKITWIVARDASHAEVNAF